MISVEVDANGFVRANFDIGITRTIYQIPLIDLPNPNGLIAEDNQIYRTSNESGTFFLWDAADGPTGDIVGYALEESATDVAGELTQLIQTQRAYSSNAKVIQTVELSFAVLIFLPVEIWFCVSTRFWLMVRKFCNATIALVFVRILAIWQPPFHGDFAEVSDRLSDVFKAILTYALGAPGIRAPSMKMPRQPRGIVLRVSQHPHGDMLRAHLFLFKCLQVLLKSRCSTRKGLSLTVVGVGRVVSQRLRIFDLSNRRLQPAPGGFQ